MLTDIEIANQAKPFKISRIAARRSGGLIRCLIGAFLRGQLRRPWVLPSPYRVMIVMIFFEELAVMIPFFFIFMLFVLPQIRFCLCKAQSFQRNAPFISTEQARNLTEHFVT